MEAREIVIVSSKTQRKSVIMSEAETLGQLKADLRANNIDYSDMVFFEGIARVELKDDNSLLPKDVSYKGTITNKLVFMLSQANKKIKSGVISRAEIYDTIKSMNLQGKCVRRYGKNFTMCKTVDLLALIEENKNKTNKLEEKVETKEITTTKENSTEFVDVKAREAIKNLAYALYYDNYIESEVYNNILDSLDIEQEETKNSSYSDEEIDDMFDFVK